jgi:hypothetical protein
LQAARSLMLKSWILWLIECLQKARSPMLKSGYCGQVLIAASKKPEVVKLDIVVN